MRRISKQLSGGAAVLAAACLWCNCAPSHAAEKATSTKTGATKTSTSPAPQTSPPVGAPFTNKFLSSFSTDNPRDPFNPGLKPKSASQPVLTGPQSALDQPALLAA